MPVSWFLKRIKFEYSPPLVLIFFCLLATGAFAQLGELVPAVECLEHTSQSYSLYRPSDYTRKKRWPVLVLVDPKSQAQAAVGAFQEGAEAYGFILASPHDFELKKDLEIQSNPLLWVLQDLIRRFAVDIEGIYFAGLGQATSFTATIASRMQTNAGLVLCGPSAQDLAQLGDFTAPLAITSGDFDPSSSQLLTWVEQHPPKGQRRVLFFEGGRQWPQPNAAAEVLGWLVLQRWKHHSQTADEAKLQKWYEKRRAYARQLETQSRLNEALASWLVLDEDFAKLPKSLTAKDTVERLLQSPLRLEQVTAEKQARLMESQSITVFQSFFNPQLHTQPKALQENLAWWHSQYKTLVYISENATNTQKRNAANRLIEWIWWQSYLKGLVQLDAKQFQPALYHFRIASEIFSDQSFVHYALACALAGTHQSEPAITALEHSISLGLTDPDLLRLQPLFDAFRNKTAFTRLLKKIQGETP